MSGPVVIPPGGGEIVGDSPERRVEILCDADALNATWSRFGPGREGADLHVHREHHDLFYVLDGTLTLRLGIEDEQVPVSAGTLARVPPNVVHGFRNATGYQLRYLNLHAPGKRFADYMRALRDGRQFSYDQYDPPADGGRPIADAVVGGSVQLDEIAVAEVPIDGAGDPRVDASRLVALYVLDGEIALTVDDTQERCVAGTWVHIPPGVAHAVGGAGRVLEIRA